MGWQERDYASEEGYHRTVGGRPLMRLERMQVSTMLIVANVAVYILDVMTRSGRSAPLLDWGAMSTPAVLHGQVWRLVTSQYLHIGTMHLFFNMLGLYFLGRYLEQYWGRRKFFYFYTACGLAGNLFYLLINVIGWLPPIDAIGASGCVLGVLGACAVLFPGIQLIVVFFPMKIRTAAALFLGLYVLNLLSRGVNAGGDAAHLAGLVVGGGYAYWRRRGSSAVGGARTVVARVIKTERPRQSSWRRKLEQEEQLTAKVDQILAKIKDRGIGSLTTSEKKILARASQQREEDEQFGRIDKL